MPPPALLKPQRLWTGKQLITALLDHVTGRGLHSFPFQLNLSSSVHRTTQLQA
jgi:hypothetical protein